MHLSKTTVQNELQDSLNKIADILATQETGLTRIISARHEFGTEWHRFMYPAAEATSQQLNLSITKRLFPFMFKERPIKVREVGVVLILDNVGDYAASDNLLITVKLPDGSETSDDLKGAPNFGGQPSLVMSTDSTLTDAEKQIGVIVNASDVASISPALKETRDGKSRLKPDAIVDMLIVLNYTIGSS